MESFFKNRPLKIKSPKNISLLGLDKNIAHLISGYLIDKDLVNLCMASKNLHSIFYPSLERGVTLWRRAICSRGWKRFSLERSLSALFWVSQL